VTPSPFADFSVQVTRRRARCVLDPNLALSREGPRLTRLLAPYAEQWVGPEFFTVLDSAQLYRREPELLIWPGTDRNDAAAVAEALRDWMQLREEAGRCLYWVGDALRESFLPEDIDDTVVSRWEAAARTLDCRLPRALEATGPLIAAMRDAAALCAVLPNAAIVSRGRSGEPPTICQHLQHWGIPCDTLAPSDALAAIERVEFQRLLVLAGSGPLIWSGLQLAVVHLCIPHIGRLDSAVGLSAEQPALADEPELDPPGNPWEDARCFWYDITEPTR
jgi:hypothetical protein